MFAHPGSFRFDGVLRHDHVSGDPQRWMDGEGRCGSESPMACDRSEYLPLDARELRQP
jgi:carotenoid cleavage dioxygenase